MKIMESRNSQQGFEQIMRMINMTESIPVRLKWDEGVGTIDNDFFEVIETENGEYSLVCELEASVCYLKERETHWSPRYEEQVVDVSITNISISKDYETLCPLTDSEMTELKESITNKFEYI